MWSSHGTESKSNTRVQRRLYLPSMAGYFFWLLIGGYMRCSEDMSFTRKGCGARLGVRMHHTSRVVSSSPRHAQRRIGFPVMKLVRAPRDAMPTDNIKIRLTLAAM